MKVNSLRDAAPVRIASPSRTLSLTAAGRTTQRAIGRRHARSVTRAMTAGLTRAEMAQLEMICRKLACASDTREVVLT